MQQSAELVKSKFGARSFFIRNRQISRYIDAREIMKVAEHNGKFCNIPKHGRKFK